eukprot:2767953-Prymnesium_polylepis.1
MGSLVLYNTLKRLWLAEASPHEPPARTMPRNENALFADPRTMHSAHHSEPPLNRCILSIRHPLALPQSVP